MLDHPPDGLSRGKPRGEVAEWLKAADCKSARASVRWFESSPLHHPASRCEFNLREYSRSSNSVRESKFDCVTYYAIAPSHERGDDKSKRDQGGFPPSPVDDCPQYAERRSPNSKGRCPRTNSRSKCARLLKLRRGRRRPENTRGLELRWCNLAQRFGDRIWPRFSLRFRHELTPSIPRQSDSARPQCPKVATEANFHI